MNDSFMSNSKLLAYITKERKKIDNVESWINCFPENWAEDFLELGLRPFLKKYGYNLPLTDNLVKRITYWAWSHVFVSRNPTGKYLVRHQSPFHSGSSEEYDWFSYKISYEPWEDFMNQWMYLEWLDESAAGLKQRADLQYFVWGLLDLDSSLSHHRWNEMIDYQNDDSDKDHNKREYDVELHAFAGDRRTH